MSTQLTNDELILEAALIGLEQKKIEVQNRIDEIRRILHGGPKVVAKAQPAQQETAGAAPAQKRRRTMSPEARERIAAAQRKRWAASKKAAAKLAKAS